MNPNPEPWNDDGHVLELEPGNTPDRQAALDAAAKKAAACDSVPPGPLFGLRGWHVMRGEGDGATLYFGRHRGAGYVSLHLRGFNGWRSYPTWMPGGWEYFSPTLYYGRLFTEGASRSRSLGTVLIPAHVARAWRWATSPTYRRVMRDRPMEER
jgi:hypothetical protein